MNGDLKQTFILHVVRESMELMETAVTAAIRKHRIGKTDELVKSVTTKAYASGQGAVGQLIFHEYGRMVDMGVGRKYPLGGIKAVTEELLSSPTTGTALVNNKRRAKKWYSKAAYGKLDYMETKLMYGFTDAIREELKNLQPKQ